MSEWSQRFKYTEEAILANTPESGGIYRLLYYSEDKYYVFYIGQSDNLRKRLIEHLNTSEPNECIKKYINGYSCYFRYLEVSTQSERDRIETQQREEYQPTCNKQ